MTPSDGATLTGTVTLDGVSPYGSEVTSFQYALNGGVVATAKPTLYGWLAQEPNGTWGWDSTSVPNGTYTLTPVVGFTCCTPTPGAGVTVTVSNPVPTAQVLIPNSGATLVGTTTLDGTASYPQNVTQFAFDLDGTPIGTATRTIYGFILHWTTNPFIANGTHTVSAVATYADGATATSPGVSVLVFNGTL